MYSITSKRVLGNGIGDKIGFPTVNIILDELPNGLYIGLWASISLDYYNSMTSISNNIGGGFRIETHIINSKITIGVGQEFNIKIIDLIRPYKKNDENTIKEDLILAGKFFSESKSCANCQLCYIQDHVYSNWTVEGTYIGCFANVYESSENTYNIWNYVSCKYKIDGQCWEFDVDGDIPSPPKGWVESKIREVKIKNVLDNE